MKSTRIFMHIAIICLVCTSPAYAYLDPGTGSIIFQMAIAVFLGVAATGKLWWQKLKGLFKSSSKSDGNEN